MSHESAAQHAKGLHSAAISLHKESEALLGAVPSGESADKETLDGVVQLIGHSVAEVVLHAFSIEVMLKAIHGKEGIDPSRTHHLGDLFSKLPAASQSSAEKRYIDAWNKQKGVPPTDTLATLLNISANAFEQWRYSYEGNNSSLNAYVGGMQIAFEALYEQYVAP